MISISVPEMLLVVVVSRELGFPLLLIFVVKSYFINSEMLSDERAAEDRSAVGGTCSTVELQHRE